METNLHILIADDYAGVRRGLRELLSDAFPQAQFSEASDGNEVLMLLSQSQFSILLMDINMPGRSGLEVLDYVKQQYQQLPVIMLSVQPAEQYAARCLKAGAAAYLSKDGGFDVLTETIQRILGMPMTPQQPITY
jgi:DNA-binding NarL/FixJ family response regulator